MALNLCHFSWIYYWNPILMVIGRNIPIKGYLWFYSYDISYFGENSKIVLWPPFLKCGIWIHLFSCQILKYAAVTPAVPGFTLDSHFVLRFDPSYFISLLIFVSPLNLEVLIPKLRMGFLFPLWTKYPYF